MALRGVLPTVSVEPLRHPGNFFRTRTPYRRKPAVWRFWRVTCVSAPSLSAHVTGQFSSRQLLVSEVELRGGDLKLDGGPSRRWSDGV